VPTLEVILGHFPNNVAVRKMLLLFKDSYLGGTNLVAFFYK